MVRIAQMKAAAVKKKKRMIITQQGSTEGSLSDTSLERGQRQVSCIITDRHLHPHSPQPPSPSPHPNPQPPPGSDPPFNQHVSGCHSPSSPLTPPPYPSLPFPTSSPTARHRDSSSSFIQRQRSSYNPLTHSLTHSLTHTHTHTSLTLSLSPTWYLLFFLHYNVHACRQWLPAHAPLPPMRTERTAWEGGGGRIPSPSHTCTHTTYSTEVSEPWPKEK